MQLALGLPGRSLLAVHPDGADDVTMGPGGTETGDPQSAEGGFSAQDEAMQPLDAVWMLSSPSFKDLSSGIIIMNIHRQFGPVWAMA